ncbi:hypothetical protein ASE12_04100 [Aeromicrobium sp. Root236]|uniref:hypothetical protein n=1 Tax=Aeromicrobium sp. Root236 TaxID=1736498 RepID=UPI0006F3D227|nr:hypothetical protein [Aeromicrobium sp. Root236]KRC64010.1 hypothetical protein ASE12_04100 [Aeromicrobium sp. Root236]
MATDFKSLGKFEQGALIAGGLSIILSFFGAYVRVSGGGVSKNVSNAWDSYATLGILLVIVATVIIAIKAFAAENLPDGVPWNLVALAAAGLGTLLLILRAFTYSDGGFTGIDVGPGWSGWVLFITTIALTVFAFLLFKASGEKIPEINKKDTPPAPPAA